MKLQLDLNHCDLDRVRLVKKCMLNNVPCQSLCSVDVPATHCVTPVLKRSKSWWGWQNAYFSFWVCERVLSWGRHSSHYKKATNTWCAWPGILKVRKKEYFCCAANTAFKAWDLQREKLMTVLIATLDNLHWVACSPGFICASSNCRLSQPCQQILYRLWLKSCVLSLPALTLNLNFTELVADS